MQTTELNVAKALADGKDFTKQDILALKLYLKLKHAMYVYYNLDVQALRI